MPFHIEPEFTRQRTPEPNRIGLIIPATARLSPQLAGNVRDVIEQERQQLAAPGRYSFHYVAWPPEATLLQNGAEVDTGLYTFSIKEAVIGVFDLAMWENDEFCWSFASTTQRDILAALCIGQTFDVAFDEPLAEAYHIIQYHFPSGVPNTGYGEYAVHLATDPPRSDGFRIVTAFEPQSQRTTSRLPFFFGFRVFGTAIGSNSLPVWRDMLGHAVRQASNGGWSYCLLYAAFSLESFIDSKLADRLRVAQVGDDYIDHVLRVGDREAELSALNAREQRLSKSAVRKLRDRLNHDVFTPRNRLAHGRAAESDISSQEAVTALKTTVEFIWDWDEASRPHLLTPMRSSSFDAMIDESFLRACGFDPAEAGGNLSGPA